MKTIEEKLAFANASLAAINIISKNVSDDLRVQEIKAIASGTLGVTMIYDKEQAPVSPGTYVFKDL